jgi:hypothetical protein
LKALPFSFSKNNHILSLDHSSKPHVQLYSIDRHSSRVSSEVLDLFIKHSVHANSSSALNGCLLFEDLHGLEKHPQVGDYIPKFSLIDALVHLDRCGRNIVDKISVFEKRFLLNDLNTVIGLAKKSGSKLSNEFQSLLTNNLSLFSLYEGNGHAVTANSCDKYIVPSLVLQNKLQIDPSIKLIDLSANEAKSSIVEYLGLRTYKIEILIAKSLNYFLLKNDVVNVKRLVEFVLTNGLACQVDLFKMKVFKNKANKWLVAGEIYNDSDQFVKEFVPSEYHLHEDFSRNEIIYRDIRSHLSVQISVELFDKFISNMVNGFNGLNPIGCYKNKLAVISDFVSKLKSERTRLVCIFVM